jgi:hypothetical protein
MEWLFGDIDGQIAVRRFYGDAVYERLLQAHRFDELRRRLVQSGAFIDEAWPQLQSRAATCSGVSR